MTQVHNLRHHVLVFRYAAGAAVKDVRKILFAQAFQSVRDLVLRIRGDRVAVVLLIASERQGVEREGIVFGCSDLLFNQRPENACFDV
jgi:hypothetical protein